MALLETRPEGERWPGGLEPANRRPTRPAAPLLGWAGALVVFLTALLLRVPFLPELPETPDGVRFVRALDRFDVADFSPHFPGYPVAVFLARAVPADGARAWALAGSLAAALTAAGWVVVDRSARGLVAGLAIATCPFLVRSSCMVHPDHLVVPFLALAVLTLRRWPVLSGLILGVGLGVRPSVFPFAAMLAVRCQRWRSLAGLAGGLSLWLLPTLALTGADGYFQLGQEFVRGHFLEWGGTSLGEVDGRGLRLLEGWLWRPLGWSYFPAGTVALFAALILAGLATWLFQSLRHRRAPSVPVRAAAVGLAVHLLWLVWAQNPDHSRHALLHWYAVVGVAGAGLGALAGAARTTRTWPSRLARVGAVAWIGLGGALAWSAQRDWQRTPVPVHAAVQAVEEAGFDAADDLLLVDPDRAFFRWLHPEWPVHVAGSVDEASLAVHGIPATLRSVWWTQVDDAEPPPGSFSLRAGFQRPPFLGDWGYSVRAYSGNDRALDPRGR